MKESIENHITWMKEQIKALEKKLKSHLETYENLNHGTALLTSVPGIGLLTACTLLSGIPELGALSSKALAALIGVAPFNKDSGRMSKKRSIQAGRASVRAVLYMATVASLIHNPYVKKFYHKLKAKGKPSKVALVACMRKLLTILNSVMKRQAPWVEEFQKEA
jgi:transposase